MTFAFDVLATLGVAVMLYGVLRPRAPNWNEGAMGATATLVAAISMTWPIARIWAPQIATIFSGTLGGSPWM